MQAMILAAGESSRFWPLSEGMHKSLVRVMGKSLVQWTAESIRDAGIKDIVVVQPPDGSVEKALGDGRDIGVCISYAVQREPKGMGNAMMEAEGHISGDFLVFNPNHLDAADFVRILMEKKKATGAGMVLLGKETDSPELYGVFKMEGADTAKGVVEKPKRENAPSKIRVMGIYLLPKEFFGYYRRMPEHEYAFEDALSLYMRENEAKVAVTDKETFSLKYPWHALGIMKALLGKRENRVDATAQVSPSAMVENCCIGKNVRVFENAVLKNSYIGDNTVVGNFSLVRDSSVESDCLIGAHSEVAKSLFQEDVHMHRGYIGDSIIAKGCRIGAGFVTANRRIDRGNISAVVKGKQVDTGLTYLGTIMGQNASVGSQSCTMPGVLVGSNVTIGAQTDVRENVESNTVLYSKFEYVKKQKAG